MIKQIKTDIPAYTQYAHSLESLSADEKNLVAELIEISKLIGPVFKKQENLNFPGANFYPSDVTVEELQMAGEKDPSILNPYTIVKRNKEGNLFSVPYAEEYKEEFKEIAERLMKVSHLSSRIKGYDAFAQYLSTASKAFARELDFSYVMEDFMKTRDNKVDFLVGPFEAYIDGLMNIKCAIDADIRVMTEDEYYTKEYIDLVKKTVPSGGLYSKTQNGDGEVELYARIDDVVVYAGSESDFITSGASYPSSSELAKRLGIKTIVYTTGIKHKLLERGMPFYDKVFSKKIINTFNQELLVDGAIRRTFLHELTEGYTNLRYDLNVFGDNHLPIQELNADMTSLKVCGIHMLTGATTDDQLRATILAFIIRSIIDYNGLSKSAHNMPYVIGRSIAIKRMFENGAISKSRFLASRFSIDFYKAYKVIEELSDEVLKVIVSGDFEVGNQYVADNSNINIFKEFEHLL